MSRRNLAGKIIRKAKYGAVGKTYNYRVDVDQNTWVHFADETAAREYHAKMGGKLLQWNNETARFEQVC